MQGFKFERDDAMQPKSQIRRRKARAAGVIRPMTIPTAAAGADAPRSIRERRVWPRSPRHTRVLLLSDDSALDEPFGGWIIDSSRGGVRLRVRREQFPVGTLLRLRGPFASIRVPWTVVQVKNCRNTGDCWEIGCEFVRTGECETTRLAGPGKTRRVG